MKVKCLRFYVLETDHKCNSEKGSKAGRKARILVNGEEPKYSKVLLRLFTGNVQGYGFFKWIGLGI